MPKSSTLPKARTTRPPQSSNTVARPEPVLVPPPAPASISTPAAAPLRQLPSHDEIAARAYLISQRRFASGLEGDELSDWLQAEAELVAEHE